MHRYFAVILTILLIVSIIGGVVLILYTKPWRPRSLPVPLTPLNTETYRYGAAASGDYYLLIAGNITNMGDKPIPINETDLLIYDLPLNTSTQWARVIEATAMGRKANYTVVNTTVYVELPPGVDDMISPGETVSSSIKYLVHIDMEKRVEEINGLSLDAAAPWSSIVLTDENRSMVEETGLWNYTNPLVAMAVKYLKRERGSTPLEAVLNAIEWVKSRTRYRTRIPARHPWEVIAYREGDCDDQSNLFIALLRGMGIPSYIEIGAVYLGHGFTSSGSSGEYYHYRFVGGGFHGWTVAYVPPWGYIRIDLTIPSSNVPPIYRIKNAAYYVFPTIVTDRVYRRDYAEAGARFMEAIEKAKLRYDIYVEVGEYNSG